MLEAITHDEGQPLYGLSRCSLLTGLPEATIQAIADACVWYRCEPGEIILHADDKLDSVYFVVEGSVRIFHQLQGKREINFAEIGTGGVFGELSAIDGGGRTADAITGEGSLIAVCPRHTFLANLMDHPMLAVRLLQKLAGIIRKADQRITNLAGMTGSQRVFAELLRLSAPDVERPGTYSISPAPFHQDIASWAGTTTDVVARAIAHLMKAGLLVRYGSTLAITDRGGVEALLEEGRR
jgi:CRP/FNR family transcriptional regulator, cyclic AMP receptor protein